MAEVSSELFVMWYANLQMQCGSQSGLLILASGSLAYLMAPECIAQGIQAPPSALAVGLEGNAVVEAHKLYALKIAHVAVSQSLAKLGCRDVTGIR